jgi:hypothetical protein
MTDTIAFVTAIAPYVTAIVAIAGSFVTAWLAQRSWGKQFEAQYQLELLKERIKICQEIPDRLVQAHMSVTEAWSYQAFLYALSQVAPQLAELGLDLKPLTSHFREKSAAAMAVPLNTWKEIWRSLVRVDIYFGPEAVIALREVLGALHKASIPGDEYLAIRDKAVAAFCFLVEELKKGQVPDFGAAVFSLFSKVQSDADLEGNKFRDAVSELTIALRKHLFVSEGVGRKRFDSQGADAPEGASAQAK